MPYYDKQKNRFVGQIRVNGKYVRKFFHTQKETFRWEIEQTAPKEKWINSICLIEFLTQYLEFSEKKHSPQTFEEKRRAYRLLLKVIPPETSGLEHHQDDDSFSSSKPGCATFRQWC